MVSSHVKTIEAACLATVMANPEFAGAAVQVLGRLWPDAFIHGHHAEIAAEVVSLFRDGKIPDRRTVLARLVNKGYSAAAASVPELMQSADAFPVLQQHAETLRDVVAAREAQAAAQLLATQSDPDVINAAIPSVRERLEVINATGTPFVSAAEMAAECLEQYRIRSENRHSLSGIPTGIPSLDHEMGGLQLGEMTVLGARPSHGKSALAHNIALAAARAGFPVLIITHEMQRRAYGQRMASTLGTLSFKTVRDGHLQQRTLPRYQEAMREIASLPITIVDRPGMSAYDATAALSSWSQHVGRPGLVVCDYLQLEHVPDCGTRTEEVSKLSGLWHSAIVRSGHAGLVLSQLNRNAAGQPPKLSDLRESGAIEQDAYAVLLLYRAAVDKESGPANVALLSLAKHRNGSLTRVRLHFTGYCMQFRPWFDTDVEIEGREALEEHERRAWENNQAGEIAQEDFA